MSAILPDAPGAGAEPALHWRRDLTIAVASLLVLLAWDASGLDLVTAHWFGDAHGFAWRERWFTQRVLHDGGRWLGFAVLAGLIWNLWRPLWAGPSRRERWLWLAATLLCLLAVPALKQLSSTSCPWDLAQFGGVGRYVSHWRFGMVDGGPGRCFPSGHATAAFGFLAGWFVLRNHHPQAARWWLAGVLFFGLVFGMAQLVRGAHYASHTLWTAWLCFVICAMLAPRQGSPARATSAPDR